MLVDKQQLTEVEPGIYYDVPFEEYIKINAINHSTLDKFMKQSPFHFKYKWDNGLLSKDTKATNEGRVIHEAVLEPDKFKEKYVKEPDDWREYEEFMPKKEIDYCKRKEREAGKAGEGGIYFIRKNSNAWGTIEDIFQSKLGDDKEAISPDLLWKCRQIKANLEENSACKKLFDGAEFEVTYVWIDEETGLKCKGRLDVESKMGDYCCDLKKTKSANPWSFARDIRKYKYNSQAAFYMDGAIQLGHEPFKAFIWLACEDKDPFYVKPFYDRARGELESQWFIKGRKWYRKALEKFHYCKSTGDWHEYYDKENDSYSMYQLPEFDLVYS